MKKIDCILLIDDNKATNFLHETLIEELDVAQNIAIEYNGRDGLAFLENYSREGKFPEVILVDIHMPVMDGFDFLDGYQQRHFHQKFDSLVVMLTTSTNPRDMDRIREAGFAGYLPKPLTEEHILSLIETYSGGAHRNLLSTSH